MVRLSASTITQDEVNPILDELDLNLSVDGKPTDDNDGLFDFYQSVALNNERLLKSMIDAGQPLMKLASLRASPLLLAVWTNNPQNLSTLLDAGADGKTIDKKSGFAPLHHAAMCEDASECIKLLIENGADIKTRTHSGGFTPLFLACVLGITDNAATLLALASRRSVSTEGASFVDSNSSASGHTCLVAAVKTGNCELVSLLVHCKASVFISDPGGLTPIEAAKGRDDMLEALLGRSVRKARRLLSKHSSSSSALHRSASDFTTFSTSSRLSPGSSAPRMGGGFVGMTIRPDGRTGFLSSIALGRIPESARMRRVIEKGKQNMRLMERHLVPPPVDASPSVVRYEELLAMERSLKSQFLLESHLSETDGRASLELRKILIEKQKIGRQQGRLIALPSIISSNIMSTTFPLIPSPPSTIDASSATEKPRGATAAADHESSLSPRISTNHQQPRQVSPATTGRIPVLFLLSVDNVGRLIGKQGRIINQIREAWPGASLVVHESETPAAIHAQRERIVAVRAQIREGEEQPSQEEMKRSIDMVMAGVCRRLCLPDDDFDPQRVEREVFRVDPKVSSDTFCICLLIPGSTLPGMIGHEGQTVRSLQADTGCIIQFVTEPVIGTPNFRRCRITGTWPNLARAVIAVVEKLQDLQDRGRAGVTYPGGWDPLVTPGRVEDIEHAINSPTSSNGMRLPSTTAFEPSRFLVTPQEAAWLLGKSGRKINHLRDKYTSSISINVDTVTAEWRVVSVGMSAPYTASTSLRKAHAVLDLLADLDRYPSAAMQQQQVPVVSRSSDQSSNFFIRQAGPKIKLLIPPELFGAVMGRGGERMRRLTRATGAIIQKVRPADSPISVGDALTESVIRRTLSSHRLIEISGSTKQRTDAALRVVEIMDRKALDIAGIPDDDRDSSIGSPTASSAASNRRDAYGCRRNLLPLCLYV